MGDKVLRKSLGRFFSLLKWKGEESGESVCRPEIQRVKTGALDGMGQSGSL